MSFWNDVGTWFTGRNGVYKDDEKVEQALSDLENVSSSIATDLDDPINKAISDLNAVKGFSENVGTLNQGAFNSITVLAEDGINAMIQQIQAKKDDLDEYEKGTLIQKIGGSLSMGVGKVGEGFLSVFEGIGDAALTAGAWVTNIPKIWTGEDTAASKALQGAVEYDVSGTLMKPLTENEWAAKYSTFTKDSGAASICKGVGKALGYMTVAGYLSGANAALANAGKLGKAAQVLQSTTNANALVAGVSGFGQGTESGLQSGKGLEAATGQGAIQGLVEGGTAYAVGRIGENARINKVNKTLDAKAADQGWADDFLAEQKANAVKNIRTQGGYNDSLTRSMQAKGRSDMTNVLNDGLIKGTGKNIVQTASSTIKSAGAGLKNNFTDDSILAKTGNKIFKRTGDAVKHGTKVGKGLSGLARTAAEPLTITKSAITSAGTTIAGERSVAGITRMATEAALGGGTNALDRATGIGSNSDIAAEQFRVRREVKDSTTPVEKIDPFNPGDTGSNTSTNTPTEPNTPTDTNTPDGTNNSDSSTGGTDYSGGGSPGGGGGGSTGGTPQYKETPTDTKTKTPTDSNKTTPNTATTPNTSANITFQNDSNVPTNPNTPTNTTTPTQEIVTPAEPGVTPTNPDNPTPGATVPTGGGTSHTGGGYTDGSYVPDDIPPEATEDSSIIDPEDMTTEDYDDAADSISSIIGSGSNFTKLPTSNSAIKAGSSGSAVIPVVAGLSAAAAAGIGAKAYMDRKNNSDNGDDEDFETEEWTGEDNLDIDYNDGVEEEQYLDDDTDFDSEAEPEKYGARNNDELADMQ